MPEESKPDSPASVSAEELGSVLLPDWFDVAGSRAVLDGGWVREVVDGSVVLQARRDGYTVEVAREPGSWRASVRDDGGDTLDDADGPPDGADLATVAGWAAAAVVELDRSARTEVDAVVGPLWCVCGATDLDTSEGFWKGCQQPGCPGLDLAHVDPSDPSWEWSPHLERLVAPHLGDGWVMESGSPGGDFVLWRYTDRYSVGLSPYVSADGPVRWLLGIVDEMGGPVVDQVEGPDVTTAPEEVAAWALGLLPGMEEQARAALDSAQL